MNPFPNWREFAGQSAEKFFKTTIWQGNFVTLGINCLEPGQTQKVHSHDDADKLYLVVEGTGTFRVCDETRRCASGEIVIAPAGVTHGVSNDGEERLSVLVLIAPPIVSK